MWHHSLYKRHWTSLKFLSSTSPSPECLHGIGKRHAKLPWVLAFRLEALKAMRVSFSGYLWTYRQFVGILYCHKMLQTTAGLSASWPQVSHCKTSTSGFERRCWHYTNCLSAPTHSPILSVQMKIHRIASNLLPCLALVSFISHGLAALGAPSNSKLHIMATHEAWSWLRQISAVQE